MKCSAIMNRNFETLSESDTIGRAADAKGGLGGGPGGPGGGGAPGSAFPRGSAARPPVARRRRPAVDRVQGRPPRPRHEEIPDLAATRTVVPAEPGSRTIPSVD